MKKLLFLLLLAAPTFAQTVNVPIQNPSFEAPMNLPNMSDCGDWAPSPIPNWTSSGTTGVTAFTCEVPPDGKRVAYIQGGTISQDLGIPINYGVYVMKFWVANRNYWYPGKYKVQILKGPTELCSIDGYAIGDFTEYTLPCSVPYYISHYNGFGFPPGNLTISVSANGWQLLFDNVSLTFTPTN